MYINHLLMNNVDVPFLCTLQYDNFMAVIELNLPNSQMNSPKWENAFKMNTDLQKMFSHMGECSPIWEKISQVERAPLLHDC